MKKINNIIYLFILAIGLVSCENDINSSAEGTFTAAKEVTIGFTDANDNMTVLEDGGTVTFDVALSKALPVNATVEMSITSSDGSLNNGGVSEVSYSSVTINAGSTTASFTFTFADDTLADNSEDYTVTIGNVNFDTPLTGFYLTQNTENGTSMRTVNVIDTPPIVVVTTAGDVAITFDWAGGEDLDLYLRGQQATGPIVIENSWYSQPEEVTLLNNFADGDYYLGLDNFGVTPPYSVPSTLTITFPNGHTEVLFNSFDVAAGTPDVGGLKTWYKFNKTTNGADITYTLTKL